MGILGKSNPKSLKSDNFSFATASQIVFHILRMWRLMSLGFKHLWFESEKNLDF